MENSINSFTKKKSQYSNNSYSQQHNEEEEESGWTGYFEDFSNCSSTTSSGFGSSSMISDAASCAAWKKKYHNDHALVNNINGDVRLVLEKSCKNLNIFNTNKKKRRSSSSVVDDTLEDTASSPVNSPKVSDMRESDVMSPTENVYESNIDISQGKRRILLSDHCIDMECKDDKRNAIGRETNECTELRKRGFCLVPMSMLMNYIAGQN